jgi:hypothetical protein
MDKKQKEQMIKDYVAISDLLKLQLTKEFSDSHKDASEYEGFIEGQAINALFGDDIDAPIEAIKDKEIKEKVKANRAKIMQRVHEMLSTDPEYRKLIVYHLRRKAAIMRTNFTNDQSFLISPEWRRTALVIQPYDSEFSEEWPQEEYRRLLKNYFDSKGMEGLII